MTNNNSYDPETYWHHRGVNYQGKKAVEVEIDNLRSIIKRWEMHAFKILEVGSGWGRIQMAIDPVLQKLYPERQSHGYDYTMCDFVESMRYNCLRQTGKLPDYWDGNELPYNNSEFDLIISFSVLLHVKPGQIEQMLKEHARVCKKYIFIATYFGGLDRLAPHCFEHDYKSLFEKLDLKIEDEKFFQNGIRVNWLLSKG